MGLLDYGHKLPAEPSLEPPEELDPPKCPICGAETDTFFEDHYGDIVGCDSCIKPRDAWDKVYG